MMMMSEETLTAKQKNKSVILSESAVGARALSGFRNENKNQFTITAVLKWEKEICVCGLFYDSRITPK